MKEHPIRGHPPGHGAIGRRTLIAASAAVLAMPALGRAQSTPATPAPQRGLWMRVNDMAVLAETIEWLAQKNGRAAQNGRPGPWVGIQLYQLWGEIERQKSALHVDDVLKALDAAKSQGLAVMLQVSDKERQYRSDDAGYRKAIPAYLDAGPIPVAQFAQCPDGLCQDEWRYATMHDLRGRGKKSDVRKYAAKRWALQDQWRSMWSRLAASIGDHPALYAVLTAESALALADRAHLNAIGYPGQDWYREYLVGNAKHLRSVFPQRVQIVSNINLIPPNTAANIPKVLGRLADAGLSIWAQDLLPGSSVYKALYTQLSRFPVEKRWAMVTNEGKQPATKMIDLARELGIGHLAFINRGFPGQLEAIERLPKGQASFMPA